MVTFKNKKSLQSEALKLVLRQLMVTVALSLIILAINGLIKGISCFLGGCAYILPQFLFAWRVFSYAELRSLGQFMTAFMIGEFTKLVLSAVLFILMANYLPVNTPFMMIGFIVAIISFWFVCGIHFGKRQSKV